MVIVLRVRSHFVDGREVWRGMCGAVTLLWRASVARAAWAFTVLAGDSAFTFWTGHYCSTDAHWAFWHATYWRDISDSQSNLLKLLLSYQRQCNGPHMPLHRRILPRSTTPFLNMSPPSRWCALLLHHNRGAPTMTVPMEGKWGQPQAQPQVEVDHLLLPLGDSWTIRLRKWGFNWERPPPWRGKNIWSKTLVFSRFPERSLYLSINYAIVESVCIHRSS